MKRNRGKCVFQLAPPIVQPGGIQLGKRVVERARDRKKLSCTQENGEQICCAIEPETAQRDKGDGPGKCPEGMPVLRISQSLHQRLVEDLIPQN